ncbi:hypothetical protein NT05LM_3074 [Listeria marthii FSL S4-120]|uniref:Uncharacterized protein n=1 Tax=Listeria marthii FSL S4-120 TaxID=702457 RepID=A0ABP2JV78_9LIST|nr:hypothetical protein NT05LM_3074 [Listeria marthii FSL S4-120]
MFFSKRSSPLNCLCFFTHVFLRRTKCVPIFLHNSFYLGYEKAPMFRVHKYLVNSRASSPLSLY